ncbi:WD40 repeat-like protein [Gonapodya prolifera JEL478]|uniref:WD40 repeat-like protein n=1 Tax=Gonapodya prolifera (strain JEL478) TaxID=1344416 RepID=A0A139AK60_GONPJ|nr:WD40 repeat-like protein [Gonapodya prolifera JEL478]|eukprot:KXS17160.1 WD40 repeat-like protein [Gonapodya prolifera JEL478]
MYRGHSGPGSGAPMGGHGMPQPSMPHSTQPPPPQSMQAPHQPQSTHRLPELFEAIKQEFMTLADEVHVSKMQRDEYADKLQVQLQEMSAFQQSLAELDRAHRDAKARYEDEIQRLRREVDMLRAQAASAPGGGSAQGQSAMGGSGTGATPAMPNIPGAQQNGAKQEQPPQLAGWGRGTFPDSSLHRPPTNPTQMHPLGGPPGGLAPPTLPGPGGDRPSDSAPNGDLHPSKRFRTDEYDPTRPRPSPFPPPGGAAPSAGAVSGQGQTSLPPVHPPSSRPPSGYDASKGPPTAPTAPIPPPPLLKSDTPGLLPTASAHSSMTSPLPSIRPMPLPAGPPTASAPPPPPPATLSGSPVTGWCDLSIPPAGTQAEAEQTQAGLRKDGQDWSVVWNGKVGRKWEVEAVASLEHSSVVCCVRFSHDGTMLATGCNRAAHVYEVQTGQRIATLSDPNVPPEGDLYIRSVAFSPDGTLLATGAEDRTVRVWHVRAGRLKYVLQGHDQDIYSLEWGGGGGWVVSGSGDRTVKIWSIETGTCVFTMVNEDSAVSPGTGNGAGPGFSQIKDSGVTSVAVSPGDGRVVAAGSLDKTIRLWDSKTGQLLERFEGHQDSVYSVAFSSDGKHIVSGSLDRTVKIWEMSPQVQTYLASTSHLPPVYATTTPTSATPSSSPAPASEFPKLSSVVTSAPKHTFGGHRDFVLSVAFGSVAPGGRDKDKMDTSPPGATADTEECTEWVVSGSKDRTVTFWDARGAARGKDPASVALMMVQGHKNSVISVALSPVGGLFATGSGDWRARIWRYFEAK